MDSCYPLSSLNWLMFYGPIETEDVSIKKYEALLLPEYNQPKVPFINTNESYNYKIEYFFYHDDNYIVYHKQTYNYPYVGIEIFRRNGDPYQIVELRINGAIDHTYAKIILSPSGRYIFYVEEEIVNGESKPVGKVVELTLDKETKKFSLVTLRRITDFKERYNKTTYDFISYDYYNG